MSVKNHFHHQVEHQVRTFFKAMRLTNKKWYKELQSMDELLYAFFVIRRRMVQPKQYIVHEAGSISERLIKPEVLRDYDALKKAFAEKGDLKKFHTENSKILFPIDGLLEDRNINHVHVDRSRYQVFFLQEGHEIFIINICKHFERSRTGYNKNSLLDIIGANWPEKLNPERPPRHAKAEGKYTSSWGWHRVDRFNRWLEKAYKTVEASADEYEFLFTDNERWILQESVSKKSSPEMEPFEA